MESREDAILEALLGLRDLAPDFERHMLVFPLSLMTAGAERVEGVDAVVRCGEAALLYRADPVD